MRPFYPISWLLKTLQQNPFTYQLVHSASLHQRPVAYPMAMIASAIPLGTNQR
jgi:hypothetical protein